MSSQEPQSRGILPPVLPPVNRPLPEFVVRDLTLRLGQPGDIDEIVGYYSRNQEYLGRFSAPVNSKWLGREFWGPRVEEMHASFRDDKACNFFMFDDKRRVVGVINLSNAIRGAFHCCTLGYGLDQDLQGRGLMTEALKVAIRYAFEEMNFHRIEANYQPKNLKSENILRKLGFIEEGLAQSYLHINGIWEPHMKTSLTNQNWRPT